ncbi:target of EGR1 protein 1-like [Pseudochaenichthys georgianus]|uniref:target of EGR1 protein 1-like n=1 Tax=Pseudochaenichthys georgianus TaxID=52239 RepID=UPI00146D6E35|nr:target of EGR1 protein 1-like [Pseudochaenichthys georgianus]
MNNKFRLNKYVTEFELRLTASYLKYAYKKCKLDSSRRGTSGGTEPHVQLHFCQYAGQMSSYVDYRVCPAVGSVEGQTDVCQRFSAFGWCPNGSECLLSHDTDLIILQDEKDLGNKRTKRKRRKEKRKGKGEAAEDGAPQHKIPHMAVDLQETPDEKQGAESSSEKGSLMDTQQNEREKTDIEGNGVSQDNTLEITPTTDDNAKTNTNGGEESRTKDEGSEKLSEKSSKTEQKKNADSGSHRAGFDAFMTGYIFAHSCTLNKKKGVEAVGKEEEEESWVPSCLNKVYLSGKSAPLSVVKSTFSKSSKAHVAKMEMVWGKKV